MGVTSPLGMHYSSPACILAGVWAEGHHKACSRFLRKTVQHWDIPKFELLIRSRVLIQELLRLAFRFAAAAALICTVCFSIAWLLYGFVLWEGRLHRHNTLLWHVSFPVAVSPGDWAVSAAAELGLARPTLFSWFRYRRDTCRTDTGRFSTTVYLVCYMKWFGFSKTYGCWLVKWEFR